HTIVQFYSSAQILVNFNRFWTDEYFEEIPEQIAEFGRHENAFYQMCSESQLLMIAGEQLLEIEADSLSVCSQLYHCESAQQALENFLSNSQKKPISTKPRLSLAWEFK
ncbi:MAG: hypothetical protein OQJ89_04170, partial [Kangiellaceae bacterium]|nr:hypothetical protein [Kangiellaceae bacterium]